MGVVAISASAAFRSVRASSQGAVRHLAILGLAGGFALMPGLFSAALARGPDSLADLATQVSDATMTNRSQSKYRGTLLGGCERPSRAMRTPLRTLSGTVHTIHVDRVASLPIGERADRYTAEMDVTESGGVVRAAPSVELLPVNLDGRQIGVLSVDSPGVRDEWEMHPEQDELLYLLEGTIDVLFRADLGKSEEDRLQFREGQACLIPKGMWHRQVVIAPCKMLFLTPETVHRPYAPESGWSEPTS